MLGLLEIAKFSPLKVSVKTFRSRILMRLSDEGLYRSLSSLAVRLRE